ncbi:hypothetical protein MKX03_003753 [Papaver bracteatum]|nr:hypothetical protein MKX03_003753 [Papaver bracteatum]
MESYMILVLGCHGSGKTTLIQNFQNNGSGPIRFVCVESVDNNITKSWKYNGFLILCDLTNKYSYDYMKRICKELTSMLDNRPIVLVGNKSDSTRKRTVKNISDDKEIKRSCYEISAKDKVDVRKPFLILARSLTKLPTLTLLDDPIPGHIDDHILAENDVAESNLVNIAAEHNVACFLPQAGNQEKEIPLLTRNCSAPQDQCCFGQS